MIEILLFLVLGILAGIIMGLLPGIHPNMIILAVPFLLAVNIPVVNLIVFIVAMGITNTIVDFIPSFLLGAPDEGNEMAVLPAHKMLMSGHGYEAVKLAVTGSVLSALLFLLLLPFLALIVPVVFAAIKGFIYLFLIFIALLMILTEDGSKKFIALFVFLAAGLIGLLIGKIPVNETLILFPVLSGFFGVSIMFLQLKQRSSIPKQKRGTFFVSKKTVVRSVFSGTAAGIVAGFLPGVGSSELASLASITKNEKSFLITIGSLTMVNAIFSIACLWLISKSRSGLAVAISQITEIGFNELLLILSVFVICIGVAALLTLKLTKSFLNFAQRIDYALISKIVIVLICVMTFVFTGALGLIILVICTAFGIFVNLIGVKRGCLMGVLILPAILFYAFL
ncbi:MAG: tripartite tricarboxylate transporter permease [Candidatus Aenigmarchaeota archaeon]|nr:tripartite tricarboxylate transporter permease [Candidatus Aenigmarchaeota archaeon]